MIIFKAICKAILKIFLYIMICLSISCRTFNTSMIKIPERPISPLLLSLNFVSQSGLGYYECLLFNQELDRNLVEPNGEKYGNISISECFLVDKIINLKKLSICLLTIPNILGMPFMIATQKVEVEYRIYDRADNLIGKYSAIGEARVFTGYYYGYKEASVGFKARISALTDAITKIRSKIQADAIWINEQLKSSSKQE